MNVTRDIWGVVPIKGFADAKQRLSPDFSCAFRQALAATMVEDVLCALSKASLVSGILVVTAAEEARQLAEKYGAKVLSDGATGGHTAAVVAGAKALRAAGKGGMLSIPGDIPGVTSRELDALIETHTSSPPGFTIVPAHDLRGSNAIVMTPPDAVPLAYGNDSFTPHLEACRNLGIEPAVERFEGIGLDVDNPEDLFALFARGWPTRTQKFLEQCGVFTKQSAAKSL